MTRIAADRRGYWWTVKRSLVRAELVLWGPGVGPCPVLLSRRVGPFTALVILAEIDDISRFGLARKLAFWAGLTPTVRGSDRVAHYGHISMQGSALLRWALCEAAQTAKRSPQFVASFQTIARRQKKIATTAVARKLATRFTSFLFSSCFAVSRVGACRCP